MKKSALIKYLEQRITELSQNLGHSSEEHNLSINPHAFQDDIVECSICGWQYSSIPELEDKCECDCTVLDHTLAALVITTSLYTLVTGDILKEPIYRDITIWLDMSEDITDPLFGRHLYTINEKVSEYMHSNRQVRRIVYHQPDQP